MSDDDDLKRLFVESIYELHEEFEDALSAEQLDPARLMRLTATGVDMCAVALAHLLEDQAEE